MARCIWFMAVAALALADKDPTADIINEPPIRIREDTYQINFDKDVVLNNKYIAGHRPSPQDFDPASSSSSAASGPPMEPGKIPTPTDPRNPGDHKATISNFTKEDPAIPYYYPPRQRFPLPQCFHNPTGYVCCSTHLNELMVDTYAGLEANPKFHVCNIGAVASAMQNKAENKFNTSFEVIAGFEDFAQKIHFSGDLVCKIELGGKYMLVYATAENALHRVKNYPGRFQENAEKDLGGVRENKEPENDVAAIRKLHHPEFDPYEEPKRAAEIFEPR